MIVLIVVSRSIFREKDRGGEERQTDRQRGKECWCVLMILKPFKASVYLQGVCTTLKTG